MKTSDTPRMDAAAAKHPMSGSRFEAEECARACYYEGTLLECENAKLREAGAELLAACPHEAEGVQRARAAMKMKQALGIL